MHKGTLKKLIREAGLDGKVEVSGSGIYLEVEIASKRAARTFQKKVAAWGGYVTGYGATVLSPNYQDKGDWNDPASAHHY